MTLYRLGKFDDEDGMIGWSVLPTISCYPAQAYLTLADGLEVKTDDPARLDLLAEKALRAAQALRIAQGICVECGATDREMVVRTTSEGVTRVCVTCAYLSWSPEMRDELDGTTAEEAA